MFSNYLKVAIRSILKQRMCSVINVLGLSIGMMCCLIISLHIVNEISFDSFHENKDRLHYLTYSFKNPSNNEVVTCGASFAAAPILKKTLPTVVNFARIWRSRNTVLCDQTPISELLTFADPSLFRIFSFPLARGNPDEALARIDAVVVTESTARKYFGEANPLGKVLSIKLNEDFAPFVVTAVARDLPPNSSIDFKFVLPIERVAEVLGDENVLDSWAYSGAATYLELEEGADPLECSARINAALSPHIDTGLFVHDISPLRSLHFDATALFFGAKVSSPRSMYILLSLAGLVLLIACFNYMNLTLARFASRAREVGIRKTVGAKHSQLVAQFLIETFLVACVALLVAVALVGMFLPRLDVVTGKEIPIRLVLHPLTLAAMFVIALVAGFLPGLYPAVVLASLPTVRIFNRRFRIGGPDIVTRSLIVLQFTISIALIMSTVVMSRQINFLKTRDLGYDAGNLVVIAADPVNSDAVCSIFQSRVKDHPFVLDLSRTSAAFMGSHCTAYSMTARDRSVSVFSYKGDCDCLRTLGLTLIKGRNFSPEMPTDRDQTIIVNEKLVETFGWDDPIGQSIEFPDSEEPMRVIGVVRNFHSLPMQYKIEPAVLRMNGPEPMRYLYVRLRDGFGADVMEFLERTWKQIAWNQPFDYFFISDRLEQSYSSQERWFSVVSFSSIMAILLACMGICGLTATTVKAQLRALCMRRILGASLTAIVTMIWKRFLKLVLIACLVAWPLGYIVMNRWLEEFPYKAGVGFLSFVLSGVTAVAISCVSVGTQVGYSASANPADVLRVE